MTNNLYHYDESHYATATFTSSAENSKWVLVIEEDVGVRKLLSHVILTMGYNVTVTCNGEKGLACFLERPYDLVISDLTMIAMDGWTVSRQIKEISPCTPVGIITGHCRSDVMPMLKKSAADFAVFKSSDIRELKNAIELHLNPERR